MPSLLVSCEELFQTNDLYSVLGLEKSASSQQIKKAYHKKSLEVHPDRVGEVDRDLCTKKFQCIGAVYAILTDEGRRGLYDECREVDDENDPLQQNKDWEEYWRVLFPKVTVKDIQEFEKKYKGSEEEKEDLKKAYLEGEGSMDFILDSVLLCSVEDEDRFREIIDQMIKKKEVKKFKAYSTEDKKAVNARKRAAKKEADEAEQARKEMGLDDTDDSLKSLILARQQYRGQQVK
ncbi:dnaJ homolog subfamily C member 9 [Eurytemora carolleeae]|uniref:dnaJ homolog subfamily C member 9 n=1 Tax=Eurytemora carolleeae TaxID=1294199 RepID=UPI000C78772E|nr:dnaJ homolog subfamily C member 9 [Eurytemora carolleeae]|eukprot:XP_023347103.1 dnaJ homolog subfamily C member 9-like [Eurytemora affinis]